MDIQQMEIKQYNEILTLWSGMEGLGLSSADSQERIEAFLHRNAGLSYVARTDGRIIGTILCGHDGRRGYIYHVAVDQSYRGRGIGKMLVEKSLAGLRERGIDKCHLFVFADNIPGNQFWQANGWAKRDDIIVYSTPHKDGTS